MQSFPDTFFETFPKIQIMLILSDHFKPNVKHLNQSKLLKSKSSISKTLIITHNLPKNLKRIQPFNELRDMIMHQKLQLDPPRVVINCFNLLSSFLRQTSRPDRQAKCSLDDSRQHRYKYSCDKQSFIIIQKKTRFLTGTSSSKIWLRLNRTLALGVSAWFSFLSPDSDLLLELFLNLLVWGASFSKDYP